MIVAHPHGERNRHPIPRPRDSLPRSNFHVCPGATAMLESGKSMSREYPSQPVVGVGAIILDGRRVLLVRRARPPLKGVWSIPGGRLELGESLTDGLRREIREETGLEIAILDRVEVFERITRDDDSRVQYHYVLIDYLCEPAGGVLCAADDAADARWVEQDEMTELTITEGTPAVISKAFQLRDRLAVRS